MRAKSTLNLTAVLVGLGRFNLGFMGPLFHRAGFDLVGVNLARPEDSPEQRAHSTTKVDCLNQHHCYLLEEIGDPDKKRFVVTAAYGFDERQPDSDQSRKAIEASARADVIVSAIGTGASAQERWVQFVSQVLKARLAQRIWKELDICAADNPVGRAFATALLRNRLLDFIASDPDRDLLLDHMRYSVRFPLLLADRICSRLDVADDVCVLTEKYGWLRCGENSHYLKYVADANPGAVTIEASTLEMYRLLKLSMLNCSHAMAAYFGALDGDSATIDQALEKRKNWTVVGQALEDVAKAHLRRGGLATHEIIRYKDEILRRIRDPRLRDSIYRVGREPKRKLHRDDRISGAALLALYNNQQVSQWLCAGMAAGLAYAYYYDPKNDEKLDVQAMELQQELRGDQHDLRQVLLRNCCVGKGAEFGSLGRLEQSLVDCVGDHYRQFVPA